MRSDDGTENEKTVRQVRRQLSREGLRLWKVREGRYYSQYGPYALIDVQSNTLVAWGLSLDECLADPQVSAA